MTEREKMVRGELYRAADPELVAARARARRLTRLFNATREDELDERAALMRKLLGALGEGFDIEPPFRCDYGDNLFVGRNFYANFGLIVLDCAPIHIGDNVFCAPNVQLLAAHHPLDAALRRSGVELASPITIGDDVWLGAGVMVLPGVTIGARSVIGAGSIVTRDVPPDVTAAGVPCRVLRSLNPTDTRA